MNDESLNALQIMNLLKQLGCRPDNVVSIHALKYQLLATNHIDMAMQILVRGLATCAEKNWVTFDGIRQNPSVVRFTADGYQVAIELAKRILELRAVSIQS